jgi:purine-binding chemotaxis protein CheW
MMNLGIDLESNEAGLEGVENTHNLVTFRLEDQLYALPIEPVVQIIPMVTITRVPQIRGPVEGVINVRGAAVPVVDLRRHLDLAKAHIGLHTPIILIRVEGRVVGLIVDDVLDVLHVPESRVARSIDMLPEGLGETPVLQGMVYTPEGPVLMLDCEHLFLPGQAQILAQAAETVQMEAWGVERDEEPLTDAATEDEESKEEPEVKE